MMKTRCLKSLGGLMVAVVGLYMLSVPAAVAQTSSLLTRSENSVGFSASGYEYKEPGVMSLKAAKVGFDYAATRAFQPQWPNNKANWFVGGQVRFATGHADYSSPSSGTLDNTPNWYYEVRGLVGRDFDQGSYVLAPFTALGFRYLFNDLRGRTSTGNVGYRRESLYTTLSIGLTHKAFLADRSQLHTTVELLHLIQGKQRVRVTDYNPLRSDVTLDQDSGYGLRVSLMRRYSKWSIGPTAEYWKIGQSESGGNPAIVEPKNQTLEVGLKAIFYF